MKVKIDLKLKNWNDTINVNRTNRFLGAKEKKKEMELIKMYLLKILRKENNYVKQYSHHPHHPCRSDCHSDRLPDSGHPDQRPALRQEEGRR